MRVLILSQYFWPESFRINEVAQSLRDVGCEVSVLTDASGNYTFASLAAATYKVREVLQSGYVQTTPSNNFGISVTLAAGQTMSGKNFGVDN